MITITLSLQEHYYYHYTTITIALSLQEHLYYNSTVITPPSLQQHIITTALLLQYDYYTIITIALSYDYHYNGTIIII